MATERAWLTTIYEKVWPGLRRFIDAARERVMAPWYSYKGLPDPAGVYAAAPIWQAEVDKLMPVLQAAALDRAKQLGAKPGVLSIADSLADEARTRVLLTNLTDEVAQLVLETVSTMARAGASTDRIAQAVDELLDTTGSTRWPGRGMLIARTELTKSWNVGLLAYGIQVQQDTGRARTKRWDCEVDGHERPSHKRANGQTVALTMPFVVGNEYALYPGAPTLSAEEACNCRCEMTLKEAGDGRS